MNNRDYKEFSPNTIFHIYNRGNNKEKIFFDEQDYKAFLFRLGLTLGFEEEELKKEEITSLTYSRIRITNTDRKNFKLHAFCLMPNHFHLLVEQINDTTVSELISKVCTSYAKYLNKKYERVGHVFQDKFKAVLIKDDAQLMWASAYIHTNPIKDKIVKNLRDYKWSSYLDYTTNRNSKITYTDLLKSVFGQNNFEKETITLSRKENIF